MTSEEYKKVCNFTNWEYRQYHGTDKPFCKRKKEPTNRIQANQLINTKEDEKLFELGLYVDGEAWDLICPFCKFELVRPEIMTCPNCQRETGYTEKDLRNDEDEETQS